MNLSHSSIDYLERLVGFPTVSRDSNLEFIDFVKNEAERAGATCKIVESEDGRKANLLAALGPSDRPGILLSGHSDVVPVDGQAWTSDPFRLRRQNGRLYGRGTADMKGFIACALTLFNKAAKRISLGMKQVEPDPWLTLLAISAAYVALLPFSIAAYRRVRRRRAAQP